MTWESGDGEREVGEGRVGTEDLDGVGNSGNGGIEVGEGRVGTGGNGGDGGREAGEGADRGVEVTKRGERNEQATMVSSSSHGMGKHIALALAFYPEPITIQ